MSQLEAFKEKPYFLVLKNGALIEIPASVAGGISQKLVEGKKFAVVVKGETILSDTVAQVLTEDTCRRNFPKKFEQDADDRRPPPFVPEAPITWSKAKHIRALEQMIGGFKEARKGKPFNAASAGILNKMEKRLEQVKACQDENIPAMTSVAGYVV